MDSGEAMKTCDTCGNDYDKMLRISYGGRDMTFDSFECAIEAMARVASTANAA